MAPDGRFDNTWPATETVITLPSHPLFDQLATSQLTINPTSIVTIARTATQFQLNLSI